MRTYLLPLAIAFVSSPVAAALVQTPHAIWGPSSLTRDTVTGLSWLTPLATKGLSYQEVKGSLQTDSRFAGFRVATIAELAQLFAHASIADINDPGYGALYGTSANVGPVSDLQALVGVTFSYQYSAQGFLRETAGYIGDEFTSPINGFLSISIGNMVVRTAVATPNGTFDFASAFTAGSSTPVGSELEGVGTWLVARGLSAPPALSLSVLALLLLRHSQMRPNHRSRRPAPASGVRPVRGHPPFSRTGLTPLASTVASP